MLPKSARDCCAKVFVRQRMFHPLGNTNGDKQKVGNDLQETYQYPEWIYDTRTQERCCCPIIIIIFIFKRISVIFNRLSAKSSIIWNVILIFQSRGGGMSTKFIHEPFTRILEPYAAKCSCVKRVDCNPFTTKSDLIDFTLSNARRFYSSKGDLLGVNGLKNLTLSLILLCLTPDDFTRQRETSWEWTG